VGIDSLHIQEAAACRIAAGARARTKCRLSEYLTRLPDKKVLEERLKNYGRLLDEDLPRKNAERRTAIKGSRVKLNKPSET